jgi:hypothetical protein
LTRDPQRPGRKAGRRYGPTARRSQPRLIDERYDASLPPRCPACDGPVHKTRVAEQYQEEIPISHVIVRQFTVHIGRCGDCGPALTAENKSLMELGDRVAVIRAVPAGADAVIAAGKPPAAPARGGGAGCERRGSLQANRD